VAARANGTSARRLDTDVVVVGAGPVGLMLAGELRLGGAGVVVLDRLTAPCGESRASHLHARSMEVLDQRGLLARLGPVRDDGTTHFGGVPLGLSSLPSVHAGLWNVPQPRTEALLHGWARELGAVVRRGHDVRELAQRPGRVEAVAEGPGGEVRVRARFLVGCDGAHSTVRRLAGIPFPGTPASRELLRADVAGVGIPDRRLRRNHRGLVSAARRDTGVTRLMVHEFGRPPVGRAGPPAFAEVAAAWHRVTGEDIGGATAVWTDAFDDTARQAARYRAGRVLLAGDAAHVSMPVGGQALNLGLQDAVNLGWKLAAEARGWAPPGLLGTYHDERHPVGARARALVAAQALLLFGGEEVDAVRAVLGEVLGLDAARRHLTAMISGLDVRYGPAGGHPLLGARLPHAELTVGGARRSTASLLHPGHGVLLALGGGLSLPVAGPWSDRVRLVAASPAPGGALDGLAAVLVRPDGHVAWLAATGAPPDEDGLCAALHRWFGAPAGARPTPLPPRRPTHPRPARRSRRRARDRRQPVSATTNLTGKNALVTGASRGIGRGIALALARRGALVAVHYARDDRAAGETVAAITGAGGRAFPVRAELGVPGDVDALFDGLQAGLKEHAGGVDLDILVNNAGVMGGVAPEALTPETFDRLMAVNARAPLFVVQRALPLLREGGRVVNISSALTRMALPQEVAYAMTKAALEMVTLHFARHLGPRGITVNTVAPGVTDNGGELLRDPRVRGAMAASTAFGRIGEPADIADVVAFLASDEARWITGAFLDTSGGTLLG
jgi:NAD(P)-dependent dehydrogenase (short-subunit alcohol dehydrogenase family)/2-polyprenyl-6-methoxyphenol hydroxylase-like FAD-dependent oxidoreductase